MEREYTFHSVRVPQRGQYFYGEGREPRPTLKLADGQYLIGATEEIDPEGNPTGDFVAVVATEVSNVPEAER